jgi:hypothetical protein
MIPGTRRSPEQPNQGVESYPLWECAHSLQESAWRKYFYSLSGRAAPTAPGGTGQAHFLPGGGDHCGKAIQHRGARYRVLRTEGLPAVAGSGKNGEIDWATPAAELLFPLRKYCMSRDCLTEV